MATVHENQALNERLRQARHASRQAANELEEANALRRVLDNEEQYRIDLHHQRAIVDAILAYRKASRFSIGNLDKVVEQLSAKPSGHTSGSRGSTASL
jgi:hypothetical protein